MESILNKNSGVKARHADDTFSTPNSFSFTTHNTSDRQAVDLTDIGQ
jgi:hypothetical protein